MTALRAAYPTRHGLPCHVDASTLLQHVPSTSSALLKLSPGLRLLFVRLIASARSWNLLKQGTVRKELLGNPSLSVLGGRHGQTTCRQAFFRGINPAYSHHGSAMDKMRTVSETLRHEKLIDQEFAGA
ncbi:hypothetical protein EV715DRAFT_268234 [Schizophyllum commune]